MLRIEGLTRRFGTMTAVDNVSLEIDRGAFIGVIGRSGAGKSTLLRMINRLQDASSGRILCEGQDVTGLKGAALRDWRQSCAMIFQQFNLAGRLDVLTNVMMGRLLPRRSDLARAAEDVDRPRRRRWACRRWSSLDMARACRPARRDPVGRPAAARRHRPRAGAGARHHPGRRADRLARSAQHPGRDGRAAAHQQALRHHRGLQPPQPRPRAPVLRPAGRHGGRAASCSTACRRRAHRRRRPRSLRPGVRRGHGRAVPDPVPRCPGRVPVCALAGS